MGVFKGKGDADPSYHVKSSDGNIGKPAGTSDEALFSGLS